MIPFSKFIYEDTVTFYRSVPVTGAQGGSKRTFPDPPDVLKASVQSRRETRNDAQGRTYSVTIHMVYTPDDIGARADDKIEWIGRTLAVEVPSTPRGIGDVTWMTQCLETK